MIGSNNQIFRTKSNTVLNKSGHSRHPCFVPDLRGKAFNLSSLSMMLVVSLLYTVSIMSRYVTSIHTLLRIFITKECCILSNAFFASI